MADPISPLATAQANQYYTCSVQPLDDDNQVVKTDADAWTVVDSTDQPTKDVTLQLTLDGLSADVLPANHQVSGTYTVTWSGIGAITLSQVFLCPFEALKASHENATISAPKNLADRGVAVEGIVGETLAFAHPAVANPPGAPAT